MPETLVGLFLDASEARKVASELMELGVPAQQIDVLDAYVNGFEDRLRRSGVPFEDRKIYSEGLRRGGALVLAAVESALADEAGALMDDHGAADIDELGGDWNSPPPASAPALQAAAAEVIEPVATPVVEETPPAAVSPDAVHQDAAVHQDDAGHQDYEQAFVPMDREFEGSLRVQGTLVEMPIEQAVPVFNEEVTVERRPANRVATDGDLKAFEEGVMEFVETSEEVVVSKTSRVVEEIVITKKVRERSHVVKDTLKQTLLTMAPKSGRDPGSSR